MNAVHLKPPEIAEATKIEFLVRQGGRVRGRVGLSLVLRAGLRLLSAEFERDEQRGIEAIIAVSNAAK